MNSATTLLQGAGSKTKLENILDVLNIEHYFVKTIRLSRPHCAFRIVREAFM